MSESVLCTICARGGSKGVPSKNVREVAGKPLIAHTVEDALTWGRADDIVVSTDDDDIAAAARNAGASVPFERPEELATDDAAKLPVIQHALQFVESERDTPFDYVVDLDPTAPLRTVADIENCYAVATEPGVTNAYSVCEADKNPYFNMVELDASGYASLVKPPDEEHVTRQGTSTVYAMNASIYVYEREFLLATDSVHGERTKVSVMPPERSVDIDRPIDLTFVEVLMDQFGESA